MVGLERRDLPLFVLQFGSDYLTLKRFGCCCCVLLVCLLLLFCCSCGLLLFCFVFCFFGGSWGWGWGVFLLFDFRLHFRLLWVCSLVKSVTTFNIIL